MQVRGTASLNIERRAIRDENYLLLNGTPANRLQMSLAGPTEHVREVNIPDQLFEPYPTLIQSSGDLARKRQVQYTYLSCFKPLTSNLSLEYRHVAVKKTRNRKLQ